MDTDKALTVEESAALVARGVAAVRKAWRGIFPRTALVLGSGLAPVAERIADATDISYGDIPGFPIPTVAGHVGRLRIGTLAGVPVACLLGRFHPYEGHHPSALAVPVRILRGLGVERLVLTNAAGGLTAEMTPGSLMLVSDHINFSGLNPMVGPNDDRVGPRFFDMTQAYDPGLRKVFAEAAQEVGVALTSGVYVHVLGPNFETPAEIRLFAGWGGHAVGMSTVPEVLAAVHCGMKVAALSLITNLGAGLSPEPLSHAEVITESARAHARVESLLLAVFARLGA